MHISFQLLSGMLRKCIRLFGQTAAYENVPSLFIQYKVKGDLLSLLNVSYWKYFTLLSFH